MMELMLMIVAAGNNREIGNSSQKCKIASFEGSLPLELMITGTRSHAVDDDEVIFLNYSYYQKTPHQR